MDFTFSDEQKMLRDALQRFLKDKYGFETRAHNLRSSAGWDAGVWQAYATELGILGAGFSEKLGGFGGGAIDHMIVMEEIGAAIAIEPYLQTAIIAGGFLKHSTSPIAPTLAEKIINGEAIIAYAYAENEGRYAPSDIRTSAKKEGGVYILNGQKAVVIAAPWATHLIITARTSANTVAAFLLDKSASGVSTRDYPTVDGFRASEIYLENVSVVADHMLTPENGMAIIDAVMDEATAALCAEACGVMRALHASTLDYARQRKQFGVPIAAFQVLQHRMVDMFMALEQAVSMTYMATLKLDADPITRAAAVSAAKVNIARACRFVGQSAVQIHGGMGITTELAVGHYFKRATMIESQFGSADYHLARYEALTLNEAA
jgi:alkylation response protein AidB-like acyl-CoA dehydrogenase